MNKVTKFGKLSILALLVGLTGFSTLKAQAPAPIWSIDAPTGGWFTTDGNTRGLSLNPATGNLIAASRTGSFKPVLINSATGDSVGVLNTTGITGGLIPYVFIQATSDGQIFASNVVNNDSTVSASGGTLKIYHWANETAEPTVIYQANHGSTLRVGDSFKAYGTGTNITLLLSGGSTLVVKINWDGTTATRTDYTVTSGVARGGFSSQINDSTVWVTGTGTAPTPFDFKNGVLGTALVTPDEAILPQGTLNSSMTSDVFTLYGDSYLFLGPATTGKQFWLLNLTANKIVNSTVAFTANANTVNNGTAVADKANGRLYVLMTNNVIQAYKLSDFVSAPKVFFSEYIEGGGQNKALEIYNAEADTIDLSKFKIVQGNNGKKFTAASVPQSLTLEGKLAPGKTYVLVNVQADSVLLAKADFAKAYGSDVAGSGIASFNGDDALGLFYNGDLIDLIGEEGVDPGSNWAVAGTSSTVDFTLVRKPGVTGNTTALASFGTDEATSEWIVYPKDTFTYLGSHDFVDAPAVTEINVTLTLNLATLSDTALASDKVLLQGGVKGARGSDTFLGGQTLGWDDSATAELTNVGGDYWSATFKLAPGDTLLYKYRFLNSVGTVNKDEQGVLVPKDQNPKGWDTRFVIAGEEDMVLDADFWQVEETATGITSGIPYATNKKDTVAFFFRVNVGAAIQAGEFNIATDSVGVRGEPNGLDWGITKLYLTKEETVSGENQMYSGSLYINKDSISVEKTYLYKFVTEIGANNEIQWDTDPNRELKGTHSNTTIQYQYFQRKKPTSQPLVDALLNFTVDVGILEGLGYFDSGVGDKVQVKGDFNGWGDSDPLTFDPIDFTWALTGKSLKRVAGDKIQYKFYIGYDASRFDETSVNYLQGINVDFGYEEPGLTGGGNRTYTITSVSAPESQGPANTFYNGVDPRGLIENPMDVTFSVDMNPAKAFTDPFNPAVDSVYIKFETKYFSLVNGVSGDLNKLAPEAQEKLRFTDPDKDGIYTLTMSLATPSPNHIGFVIVYGQLNSESGRTVTNGSGFDAGRRYYQYVVPTVDNGNIVWPSTYSFPTLTWAEKDLPWELALDYDALPTGIDESTTIAEKFSLSQNYPNPFNPSTTISFSLPSTSAVRLSVYNVLGQRVATLINNQVMSVGKHSLGFDASKLASGTYLYRLEAGSLTMVKKMTLIK